MNTGDDPRSVAPASEAQELLDALPEALEPWKPSLPSINEELKIPGPAAKKLYQRLAGLASDAEGFFLRQTQEESGSVADKK